MNKVKEKFSFLISIISIFIILITSLTWAYFYSDGRITNIIGTASLSGYFQSGDGTSSVTAFEIVNQIQLANLSKLNALGVFKEKTYFKITKDIDCTGIVILPIGSEQYPFNGELEGNKHVISNLTISNTTIVKSEKYEIKDVGFIGFLGNEALAENFILENPIITSIPVVDKSGNKISEFSNIDEDNVVFSFSEEQLNVDVNTSSTVITIVKESENTSILSNDGVPVLNTTGITYYNVIAKVQDANYTYYKVLSKALVNIQNGLISIQDSKKIEHKTNHLGLVFGHVDVNASAQNIGVYNGTINTIDQPIESQYGLIGYIDELNKLVSFQEATGGSSNGSFGQLYADEIYNKYVSNNNGDVYYPSYSTTKLNEMFNNKNGNLTMVKSSDSNYPVTYISGFGIFSIASDKDASTTQIITYDKGFNDNHNELFNAGFPLGNNSSDAIYTDDKFDSCFYTNEGSTSSSSIVNRDNKTISFIQYTYDPTISGSYILNLRDDYNKEQNPAEYQAQQLIYDYDAKQRIKYFRKYFKFKNSPQEVTSVSNSIDYYYINTKEEEKPEIKLTSALYFSINDVKETNRVTLLAANSNTTTTFFGIYDLGFIKDNNIKFNKEESAAFCKIKIDGKPCLYGVTITLPPGDYLVSSIKNSVCIFYLSIEGQTNASNDPESTPDRTLNNIDFIYDTSLFFDSAKYTINENYQISRVIISIVLGTTNLTDGLWVNFKREIPSSTIINPEINIDVYTYDSSSPLSQTQKENIFTSKFRVIFNN